MSILAPELVNFVRRASPRPIPETMPSLAAMDCMMMTDMTERNGAGRDGSGADESSCDKGAGADVFETCQKFVHDFLLKFTKNVAYVMILTH